MILLPQTHQDQLEHVKKGCLARPRDDIRSDGSRIEGSHKGWNGLQRSHASGIESLTALCYDFVLRRNLRVELSGTGASPSPFAVSTFGSHHIHLVNACAKLWNALSAPSGSKPPPAGLIPLPELCPADSGETFGLVKAGAAIANYHNLIPIKEEPLDDLIDLSSQDPDHAADLCAELGIDPALMLVPQKLKRTASSLPSPPSIVDNSSPPSSRSTTRTSHVTPNALEGAPRAPGAIGRGVIPTSDTPEQVSVSASGPLKQDSALVSKPAALIPDTHRQVAAFASGMLKQVAASTFDVPAKKVAAPASGSLERASLPMPSRPEAASSSALASDPYTQPDVPVSDVLRSGQRKQADTSASDALGQVATPALDMTTQRVPHTLDVLERVTAPAPHVSHAINQPAMPSTVSQCEPAPSAGLKMTTNLNIATAIPIIDVDSI